MSAPAATAACPAALLSTPWTGPAAITLPPEEPEDGSGPGFWETDEIHAFRRRVLEEYRAGNLPDKQRNVANAVAGYAAAGYATPSWGELAKEAGCSVRTVARAMVRLGELGLLSWRHRHEVRAGRVRRIENLYTVHVPETPVLPRARRRSCHGGIGSKEERKKRATERSPSGGFGDEDTRAWWNAQRQIAWLLAETRSQRT